jgi:protein SCO1
LEVRNPKMVWGLLAGFAALAGVAVSFAVLRQPEQPLRTGELLNPPRPVADFSLTGDDGQPYTKANLLGHWNLIYVGYTFCPDVCPTTLAQLKAVQAGLGADAAKLKVTFLSIDPERDTPQHLAQYVHYFSPSFSAATGPNAQLDAMGANLNFVYQKVPGATPQSYLMDHSSALILIDPQARLAGYLVPPFKTPDLIADLKTVLEKSS